jgi:predicted tellurium resistance membrane protein TerC
VLGVDNIIFISIVSNKLPHEQQAKARLIGLSLALIVRIFLLLGISYIIGFTQPLLTIIGFELSGRDLILAVGGIFLLAKSTSEIHHKMSGEEQHGTNSKAKSFAAVITQIIALDFIFSFDSILTAVGLTEDVLIMIIAVILAMIVMIVFSGKISEFINNHPTLQVLALSFLILIGFMLLIEALHYHVPKGYIYFAVAFSLSVEFINMKIRKKKTN